MRIAILFHENERNTRLERYYLTHPFRHRREDGHEVVFVFGPSA